MTTVLNTIACLADVIVGLPTGVVSLEIAAALLPRRATLAQVGNRPPVAVLIPAHNERGGIATTVRAVQNDLRAGDRLLVVADNCTDDTAAEARQAGAEVIEDMRRF